MAGPFDLRPLPGTHACYIPESQFTRRDGSKSSVPTKKRDIQYLRRLFRSVTREIAPWEAWGPRCVLVAHATKEASAVGIAAATGDRLKERREDRA